ncbi:MAG: hypothetical protein RIA69_12720 [Cyclobacteriaceae bacterium]
MGIFWDLIQQDQIETQKEKANSLEERVDLLEKELIKTRQLLMDTLHVLETHLGQDIDKDGKIG